MTSSEPATLVSDTSPPSLSITPEGSHSNGESRQVVVSLAGNPNVGKSVFFNAFTGKNVDVSNFPGTTVDITSTGFGEHSRLQDTPGVYGLSQMSDEEKVAESALMKSDVIINVVSALTLDRDLFLTQQLIDRGKAIIVALNQMDEAKACHRHIDIDQLAEFLGVPVFPTVAIRQEGLPEVKDSVNLARLGHRTPGLPPTPLMEEVEHDPGERMKVYGLRRQHIDAIISHVVVDTTPNLPGEGTELSGSGIHSSSWRTRWSRKLGHMLLNPIYGAISMVAVLLVLYQVVGVWVAGDLVNLLEGEILLGHVIPVIQSGFTLFLSEDSQLFNFLAGEFGLITMSIQYILGVIFPLVLGFYLYLSILEDCGYLPRIAVLSDGLLSRIGLNGRAIIPVILGLGCVTMASVSTRMLNTNRERTIASALLALTIPCSAQLGVIMGLMAKVGGLSGWLTYLGILFTIFIGLGTILDRVLPGQSSPLVLDLPPLRLPTASNVLKKTWYRTQGFVWEAIPVFVIGSGVVALLHVTGLFQTVIEFVAPITMGLLKLPAEAAQAFVMGMVRRDFGVAGLTVMSGGLTSLQVLTSLVVITLFVPCIASAAVILKERGRIEATAIFFGSCIVAFLAGGVVCRVFEAAPWLQ